LNSSNIPFYSSSDLLAKYQSRESILSFIDIVLAHNRDINLVSRETSRDDLIRITADCLIPLEIIPNLSGRFFDIGPGAGFPSIIYMLALPGSEGVLIERTRKKSLFLSRAIELLGLKGSVVDKNFVEAATSLADNSFDFGLMKYVSLDRKIFSSALPLLKPSGYFIYYSSFDSEQIIKSGSASVEHYHYYLDDRENLRNLTIFSKTA
jgi:16S rRNA (guanine527-N7)-methyltransferase